MSAVAALHFPEGLHYTEEHVWARVENGVAEIGISDFAQHQLTEIAYVDLPSPGQRVTAGEEFGAVESLKAVNSLFSPFSGEVAACNTALDDTPTLVNVDPYGKGWMIRVVLDTPGAAVPLLDAAAYRAVLDA